VKTLLRYMWWIGSCVVQLAVILFVFGNLKGRLEGIVVSILGLLYVTIRSYAIVNAMTLAQLVIFLDKEFTRTQELLREDAEEISARRELLAQAEGNIFGGKMIIMSVFLIVVSLVCFVVLFGSVVGPADRY
jgi:hypothetical protein